ncbi:MAG: hypothetical protein KAT68_01185 [Bacteroidales bacterium]|nr:hypothetical protein [Bacteroidales bacterium]
MNISIDIIIINKRYRFLISIFVLFILIFSQSGCSLTKTQINTCNRYFDELNNFYGYANEINEHTANVKFNRQKLIASSDSIIYILDILDSAITNYQDDVSMPFELRKSLMSINSYVAGYSFKSSYNTDFLRSFKRFLIDYVPFGIGDIIFEIVYSTRKIIIKPNVGKKIKKHIVAGNETIEENTKIIITHSNQYIKALETEKKLIKSAYKDFDTKLRNKPDSWDNYSKYNPIFIKDFSELYYTIQMAQHLKNACENLEAAQISLSKATEKRRKIKKQIPELDDFYVEISYLNKLTKLLNKSK